jgi:hypothetical protein
MPACRPTLGISAGNDGKCVARNMGDTPVPEHGCRCFFSIAEAVSRSRGHPDTASLVSEIRTTRTSKLESKHLAVRAGLSAAKAAVDEKRVLVKVARMHTRWTFDLIALGLLEKKTDLCTTGGVCDHRLRTHSNPVYRLEREGCNCLQLSAGAIKPR